MKKGCVKCEQSIGPFFEEFKFFPRPFWPTIAWEAALNRATRHGNLRSAFTRKLGLLGASGVQKHSCRGITLCLPSRRKPTLPDTHVRASLWIIRINDTARIVSRYGASRRPIANTNRGRAVQTRERRPRIKRFPFSFSVREAAPESWFPGHRLNLRSSAEWSSLCSNLGAWMKCFWGYAGELSNLVRIKQ